MGKRSAEVDTFLAELEHPQKRAIERMRQLILRLSPLVTEKIKWKVPSFGLEDLDQITFHLRAKAGVQLVLHRGVAVKSSSGFAFADPAGLLKWPAKDRALLTVRDLAELTAKTPAVRELLRRWLEETR